MLRNDGTVQHGPNLPLRTSGPKGMKRFSYSRMLPNFECTNALTRSHVIEARRRIPARGAYPRV